MATATPETLGQVLTQIVQAAADEAAQQPQQISDAVEQVVHQAEGVVEEIRRLPDDILNTLRNAVDPPDWWSLLVFVMLRIGDLDPQRLSVGVTHPAEPANWSRMVTLTYVDPARPDDGTVTLGLALTDPGTTKGMWLRTSGSPTFSTDLAAALSLTVTTSGQPQWWAPFSGPIAAPSIDSRITATLVWDPGLSAGDPTKGVGFALGAFRIDVTLSSIGTEPWWALTIRLGAPPHAPGVRLTVDLATVLGSLATIVTIAPVVEQYSPSLVLAQGANPTFDLGEQSAP